MISTAHIILSGWSN